MSGQRRKSERLKEPLSITHPQLAAEWHPTKNGELRAENVTAGSSKKVWWRCVRGHEWQATIAHRTDGQGCRKCSGRVATAETSLRVLQ